jgi:hypothetical protein
MRRRLRICAPRARAPRALYIKPALERRRHWTPWGYHGLRDVALVLQSVHGARGRGWRTLVQDEALAAERRGVRDALVHDRDIITARRGDSRVDQVAQRRRAAPPARAAAARGAPGAAGQRAAAAARRLPRGSAASLHGGAGLVWPAGAQARARCARAGGRRPRAKAPPPSA